MGDNNNDWVALYFCPALGTIICNIMWSSPFSAILHVRKSNSLGSLNPIPFGITVMNCTGWVLYGILRRDYFIFFSNIFGLIFGLFYSFSSISALSIEGTEKRLSLKFILEMMLLGSVMMWAMIGFIVGIVLPSELTEKGIVSIGIIGCGCGLAYYGSFFTTMAQVIKTKDSSSLYLPTLLANISNATLWVIYGFAIQDPVVWSPNFLGATLTALQISLYFIYYPRNALTGTASIGSVGSGTGGGGLGGLGGFLGGNKGDREYILQHTQRSDDFPNPLIDEEKL